MSKYRLIAFDMDGTLLKDDKTIDSRTLEAIEEADRQGKSVVICTGRPIAELRPYKRDFTHIRYAICECGAYIYDYYERRCIAHHTLAPDYIDHILEVMELEEMMPQALIHGESYVNQKDIANMGHFAMGVYQSLYEEVATPVDDIFDVIRTHKNEIEKINLYHASPEGRERTFKRLTDIPIEKTYAERTSVELSAPGVTKGSGLLELAHVLGIARKYTIAAGDADNDVPMIKAAGLGVAMGNANDHAKSAADYITLTNEENGCGDLIEKYLLD